MGILCAQVEIQACRGNSSCQGCPAVRQFHKPVSALVLGCKLGSSGRQTSMFNMRRMAAAVFGSALLAGLGMMLAEPAQGQMKKEMGGLRRRPPLMAQPGFPPGMQPTPTTLNNGNASQFSAIKL